MNYVTSEQFEEALSLLRQLRLDYQGIHTKLLTLEPPKATIGKSLPLASTALLEKAKLLRCPKCGGDMAIRYRKSDQQVFFGCKGYPECNGLLPGDAEPKKEDVEKAAYLKTPITRLAGQPKTYETSKPSDFDGPIDGQDAPF